MRESFRLTCPELMELLSRLLSCGTPLESFLESEGIGQARTQALVHAGQRVSVSAVQPRCSEAQGIHTSHVRLRCSRWSAVPAKAGRGRELGLGPHLFGPTSVPVAGGIGPTGHGALPPALAAYACFRYRVITHIGE